MEINIQRINELARKAKAVDRCIIGEGAEIYGEPCGMEEKSANHACMNECFFLEFHMARSHIEMERKRN